MLRVILTILVPLLLPTLVYLGYIAFTARGRAAAAPAGGEAEEEGAVAARPWTEDIPWLWLIGSGVLLMSALLITLALTTGHERGGVYIPAHRLPDGTYVPARTVPADQVPAQRPPAAEPARP